MVEERLTLMDARNIEERWTEYLAANSTIDVRLKMPDTMKASPVEIYWVATQDITPNSRWVSTASIATDCISTKGKATALTYLENLKNVVRSIRVDMNDVLDAKLTGVVYSYDENRKMYGYKTTVQIKYRDYAG